MPISQERIIYNGALTLLTWAVLPLFTLFFVGFIVRERYYGSSPESKIVDFTLDAGSATAAVFHPRFGANSTAVETDKGAYLVYGIFHLSKGQPMVLETRKNGDRMLCIQNTIDCYRLVK